MSPTRRDLLGVVMLCYVIITVPVTFSFALDTKLWTVAFFVDAVVVRRTDSVRIVF